MKLAKVESALVVSLITFMAGGSVTTYAAQPAFYHYYYVYPDSMEWCGKLVHEVYENTNRNWHFTKHDLTKTTASFSVGNLRGILRCLSKGQKESWVVIMSTGNDGHKTKDLFEELRLGVCGECSTLGK